MLKTYFLCSLLLFSHYVAAVPGRGWLVEASECVSRLGGIQCDTETEAEWDSNDLWGGSSESTCTFDVEVINRETMDVVYQKSDNASTFDEDYSNPVTALLCVTIIGCFAVSGTAGFMTWVDAKSNASNLHDYYDENLCDEMDHL